MRKRWVVGAFNYCSSAKVVGGWYLKKHLQNTKYIRKYKRQKEAAKRLFFFFGIMPYFASG